MQEYVETFSGKGLQKSIQNSLKHLRWILLHKVVKNIQLLIMHKNE